MPRINPVDPASATGRAKEIYENELKGKHFNIFKSMMASPAAVDFYLAMGGAQAKFELTAAEREVIQLAVSESNSCGYCNAAHTAMGKMAGLSEEQTVGARQGEIGGDQKLDALAKFAKAVHEKKGFVDDSDVSAFKSAGYTDGQLVETIAVYAAITFTNYFNHLNNTDVDFPAVKELAGA